MLGVAADDVDFVCQVEATLGLDHVLELRYDIAILAIERELEFAVVVLEDFVIHGASILDSLGCAADALDRRALLPRRSVASGLERMPRAAPLAGSRRGTISRMAEKDVLGRAGEDRAARYLE